MLIALVEHQVDFLVVGGYAVIYRLNFEEAFKQRQPLMVKQHEVPFLHLNDLIVSKLVTNRLKDQADVEQLMKVKRSENK